MKKQLLSLLLLLFAFITTQAAPLQKLTVILDWFPNPDHAPLLIAQEHGFFKAQGLNVELIGPADPTDPPKLVAADKADIAITYQPQFMQQVDQGLPLARFGTLIGSPLDCLITLQSSMIHSLKELKGKRIGTSTGGLGNVMLKAMLQKHGVKLEEVELINARYNLTQALLAGKVDAITGIMRNVEIPQIELTGHAVRVFYPEYYGIPTYSELIFITHTQHRHDPRLAAFLLAIKQSVVYLKSHRQETWQEYAKQYPESNNELNHKVWLATIPYFVNDPAAFNQKEWMDFARFMQQNGLIK
ncbi:MAG: hypothetical protein A3E84_01210 [Gammaproteobacteria bacterium RIFCSPHIGHO2_12_FULL_42_13]|nr:MAG: hypothetical protein A3E84_01210 [Gammaproteobacteria bacterium RIFCSPHIGHO2_12_FULL_42_13]